MSVYQVATLYERYGYECCKASTIQKISAQAGCTSWCRNPAGIILLRQPGVMAHRLKFRDFRQRRGGGAGDRVGQTGRFGGGNHCPATDLGLVKDQHEKHRVRFWEDERHQCRQYRLVIRFPGDFQRKGWACRLIYRHCLGIVSFRPDLRQAYLRDVFARPLANKPSPPALLPVGEGRFYTVLSPVINLRAAADKFLRFGHQSRGERRLCFDPLPRCVLTHFLSNLHRAEMRPAHRTEMRDLG